MILNISNSFSHQEAHDLSHWFIKAPRLGAGSLRASACVLVRFVKDAVLADSSGVNTQHLVWVMAQVTPCSNNMQGHPIL